VTPHEADLLLAGMATGAIGSTLFHWLKESRRLADLEAARNESFRRALVVVARALGLSCRNAATVPEVERMIREHAEALERTIAELE